MMNRKESAASFLRLAVTGYTREAYEKFIAINFIHHNPHFKGDRASLMVAMAETHHKSPNKRVDIKQIFEEGDTVITHSLVIRQKPNEPDIAVVHIFRFEGNKIAELWDIGQLLDKNSPNENGPF